MKDQWPIYRRAFHQVQRTGASWTILVLTRVASCQQKAIMRGNIKATETRNLPSAWCTAPVQIFPGWRINCTETQFQMQLAEIAKLISTMNTRTCWILLNRKQLTRKLMEGRKWLATFEAWGKTLANLQVQASLRKTCTDIPVDRRGIAERKSPSSISSLSKRWLALQIKQQQRKRKRLNLSLRTD